MGANSYRSLTTTYFQYSKHDAVHCHEKLNSTESEKNVKRYVTCSKEKDQNCTNDMSKQIALLRHLT